MKGVNLLLDKMQERVTVLRQSLTDKHNLTPVMERLLNVLIRPESGLLNITEICQVAKISRDSYYKVMKDERFVNAYEDACRAFLNSNTYGICHAMTEQALKGDIQAGTTILRMTGFFRPEALVNVNHTGERTPTLKDILDKRKKD